jgi:hypothetical protein
VLVPATAAQAKAPVASCAALAGHRCILLSPASVLRSGSSKGIPWLLVRGSAKGVTIGGTIVVGAGGKDASGFAGYVIGLEHVGDTTAIAAIPPLPGAAKTKAMASGSVSALGLSSGRADGQRTAASSPLSLLPPSLLAQLEGVDYGCKSSTAFPLQLTGFSIDPNSGSVAMAPSKGSPFPSAVSVGFQISPAFTAKLNLKEQYQCQAKKELAVTKAIAAIGGIPGIIRTSAEVSAQAGIEGSATGSVKLGFTAGASVTAAGGAVSVQGANFSGTAQVTAPLAVHATGSLQAKTKAVVRLLAYGVWGPRVSLAWGPELKLASLSTDPNTPPENTCSNATLSMPITLAAGVSFEPGIYEGTNAAVRALSESIGGKWVQGLVQTSISALSMGGNPIAMPLEKREFKNVWRLEKALDSGDLYTQDFKPIADQELPTIGNGLTSPNCQPRLTSASFKVTGAQLHYVRVTTFGNCSTIGDTLDTLSWDTEWDSMVDGFDQGPGPLPLAVGRYATTPRIGASGNVVVTNSLMGPCMNPQPGCSSTITYPSSNGPQYSFFRVTAVNGDGAARTYAIHVNAIIDAAGFSSGACQTSLETAFSPPVTNTDVTLTASGANAAGPRTQSFPVTVSRTVTDQGLTFTETWQGTVTLNGYW